MAILFDCPHCSAEIRVADEFAGRQGRCPKCSSLLKIPVVEIPQLSDTASGIGANASVTQADADPGSQLHNASVEAGNRPAAQPAPVSRPAASVGRRRRRQRQRQRIWMLGVPVLCFLILFGIMASIMTSRLPELSGSLQATVQDSPELAVRELAWADTGLSLENQDSLREVLEEFPTTFSSAMMVCTLTSRDTGIQIRLKAGTQQSWYLIDPARHSALVLWQRRQVQELERLRVAQLQSSIAAFAREKMLIASGESVVLDAQTYRDSIGLTASTGGLGFLLEAVIPGRVVRCAYEDNVGRLYFLLPAGTEDFQIRGRPLDRGERLFPGEYQVTVERTHQVKE